MPEDPEDLTLDDELVDEQPDIRQLRKEAKEAKQLRSQLAEMETMRREHAALKAGLTGLSDKQLAAGLATYDGDISDSTALRTHFTELGIFKAEPDKPAVPDAEMATHQRIAEAAGGGEQPTDLGDAKARLLAETAGLPENEFWDRLRSVGMS